MPSRPDTRDPWRHAPTEELQDQILPRWFVLTGLLLAPAALVVAVVAFLAGGSGDVPVVERRPPPAAGLTNDVGELAAGETGPRLFEESCQLMRGVQVAGTAEDRAILSDGLTHACGAAADEALRDRLRRFGEVGGVVRFAAFEATGVDSTAALDPDPPVIYINAKFAQTDRRWIGPLIAHDVTFLDADPATAEGAVEARQAEAEVCASVLERDAFSRGCQDAAEILSLDDPVAALREAGFR